MARMKVRHAATLALVGWYLMAPPLNRSLPNDREISAKKVTGSGGQERPRVNPRRAVHLGNDWERVFGEPLWMYLLREQQASVRRRLLNFEIGRDPRVSPRRALQFGNVKPTKRSEYELVFTPDHNRGSGRASHHKQ